MCRVWSGNPWRSAVEALGIQQRYSNIHCHVYFQSICKGTATTPDLLRLYAVRHSYMRSGPYALTAHTKTGKELIWLSKICGLWCIIDSFQQFIQSFPPFVLFLPNIGSSLQISISQLHFPLLICPQNRCLCCCSSSTSGYNCEFQLVCLKLHFLPFNHSLGSVE